MHSIVYPIAITVIAATCVAIYLAIRRSIRQRVEKRVQTPMEKHRESRFNKPCDDCGRAFVKKPINYNGRDLCGDCEQAIYDESAIRHAKERIAKRAERRRAEIQESLKFLYDLKVF